MKDKCRNRLDAKYPMRLGLSNVELRLRNFAEVKKKLLCNGILFHLRTLLLSL